jgi:hypothetical protein
MTSTFLQPLGNITAGQRIVVSRPDFTFSGTYDVVSVEPGSAGRVHLNANRVGAGEPQVIDNEYPGDAGVGVVPPEKR